MKKSAACVLTKKCDSALAVHAVPCAFGAVDLRDEVG